ncbi:MAG TPA: hypothetical protein VEQ18_05085 [Candidatus Nitrosocosmicus sp.]|nr:hypothetical protein [Candidatus Nitrosocosmicus sp.]
MKKFYFYALGVLMIMIPANTEAFGCSCRPVEKKSIAALVRDAKKESAAVFAGKVLEIIESDELFNTQVKIKVINVWKGSLSNEITIFTGRDDGMCRYDFEVGKTYLVYAAKGIMSNSSGNLETTMCSRTQVYSSAKHDLRILGKGRSLPKN